MAQADITPPLGGILGGHGPNGLLAAGWRGQLQCEVMYLSDDDGESFAWVGCDLAHASTLLQRTVVNYVQNRAETTGDDRCSALGVDTLALSARHTHGSPGHHYDALNYSSIAPGNPGVKFTPFDPGYDAGMVAFLSSRIGDAVLAACADAERSLADGDNHPGLRWTHKQLDTSYTTNRSVEAHCMNERPMGNATSTCAVNTGLRRPGDLLSRVSADPRKEVLHGLDVLEVVRRVNGNFRTVAVWIVFPTHPTAVPNGNDLYHADLFESSRDWVRWHWPASAAAPLSSAEEDGLDAIVSFVNGAEGDVSPAWPANAEGSDPGPGFRFARAVGRALGVDVVAAVPKTPAADANGDGVIDGFYPVELGRVYVDALLAGRQPIESSLDDWRPPPCNRPFNMLRKPNGAEALCTLGSLGTAAAGGAEDGPTFYQEPLFRFAEPKVTSDVFLEDECQRPKDPLLPVLNVDAKRCAYPEVAPLLLLRLSGRFVYLVPFEPTTTAAIEIAALLPPEDQPPVIVSLTSGYLQYIATRAEYEEQHYEGASTLYGPASAKYFAGRAALMATRLSEGSAETDLQRRWRIKVHVLPERWRLRAPDSHGAGSLTYMSTPEALARLVSGNNVPPRLVEPDAVAVCKSLELRVCSAGAAMLVPSGVMVDALRGTDGNRLRNSIGAEISSAVQDISIRVTSADAAMITWYPELSSNTVGCAVGDEVQVDYHVGDTDASARFSLDADGWRLLSVPNGELMCDGG